MLPMTLVLYFRDCANNCVPLRKSMGPGAFCEYLVIHRSDQLFAHLLTCSHSSLARSQSSNAQVMKMAGSAL